MSLDFVNNKYIFTAITIIFALYSSLLGTTLPPLLKDLFNNTIFRIIVLFFIVVTANKDPTVSIITSIAFILTLDNIYALESYDTHNNLNQLKKRSK
jgi:hypothetical protein